MSRSKLEKRRPKQIEIDGEQVLVRAMTLREVREVQRLQKDKGIADSEDEVVRFVVSSCVINPDGSKVYDTSEDPGILDIPTDTLREISDAIGRLSSGGSLASAEKN
jgi:hypothetical protein